MSSIMLIPILAVYFIVISMRLRAYQSEEWTVKITKPISRIINLSPFIGIVIFTVLFTFLLKGRLAERVTHVFLVFALWIYAARFYQYILAYYKKKGIFAGSVIGMVFSIILAVILTPLNRYISLIYSRVDWYSIFLGLGLYIVFYAVTFLTSKKVK